MKMKAFLLLIITVFITVGCSSPGIDSKKSSANIQSFLEPDENYPFIGFWKKKLLRQLWFGNRERQRWIIFRLVLRSGRMYEARNHHLPRK